MNFTSYIMTPELREDSLAGEPLPHWENQKSDDIINFTHLDIDEGSC